LVEHAEFDVTRGCGENDVEGIAKDGGVGYAVYSCEIEEGEGLFEAIQDAYRGEEQIA
jgi:hypothetical protein